MSLFDRMMKDFFLRHDYIRSQREQEQERFDRLHAKIVARAREMPQAEPKMKERRRFMPHYAFNLRHIWPKLSFDPQMQLSFGAIILVLGLWVGHSFPSVQQNTQYAQTTAEDQKISVMAMAEPWEGWIEGGE